MTSRAGRAAELIVQDIAFRAGKELCRAPTDMCGEINPELLSDLDVAALRWAGIDPHDYSTATNAHS
ncbi:hypothetical protein [Streptomyces sp. NPDC059909]|uniref:hypothetical protein n=1 Tax=Streptomyces sp. NPDC059909 TaxID=3346998 RepID=UPI00365410E2